MWLLGMGPKISKTVTVQSTRTRLNESSGAGHRQLAIWARSHCPTDHPSAILSQPRDWSYCLILGTSRWLAVTQSLLQEKWKGTSGCVTLFCSWSLLTFSKNIASSSLTIDSKRSHFFCWRSCSRVKSLERQSSSEFSNKKKRTHLIAWTKESCKREGLKSSSLSFFVSAIVLQARRSTNSSASNGSWNKSLW